MNKELMILILAPIIFFIYEAIKTKRQKQKDERLQKAFSKYFDKKR